MFAAAIKLIDGKTTTSFFFKLIAFKAKIIADVPLLLDTLYFDFTFRKFFFK